MEDEYYKGWFSERELAGYFLRAAERDGAVVQAGRAAKAAMRMAIDAVMSVAMQEAVRHTVRTEPSVGETPAHFRRTDVYIRGEALLGVVATVPALAALGPEELHPFLLEKAVPRFGAGHKDWDSRDGAVQLHPFLCTAASTSPATSKQLHAYLCVP